MRILISALANGHMLKGLGLWTYGLGLEGWALLLALYFSLYYITGCRFAEQPTIWICDNNF